MPSARQTARLRASWLGLALAPLCAAAATPLLAAEVPVQSGINPSAMDTNIRPGDDFYAFANGGWMKNTEIPADRSRIGGFQIADQTTEARITRLIAEILASTPKPGTDAALIRNYYTAFTDLPAIEASGLAPLQPDFARFAAIATRADLARVLGEQVRADVDPMNSTNFHTENLFGLFITQPLAGGPVMPYILQGGLGLPEREYYLDSSPKMAEIRKGYEAYIAQILELAGIATADSQPRAAAIFALETKIAQAHESREQSEDIAHSFAGANLAKQAQFSAYHDKSIPRIANLVASESLGTWRDWLAFHQVNQYASVLPAKIDAARFAFFSTTLSGVKVQRSREKRAVAALNGALGDAVGRLYVTQYFPATDKLRIQAMVCEIKSAFARRIAALNWMAPATKKEAINKVKTIVVGVGYPDSWTDYKGLTLKPDTAYANAKAASLLNYRQQLAKIGKPQDRAEWWMNAQLVNAVNLPVQNALNFPAAILQKPFYDPAADPAFNYGAIGSVIGHEISHSFDNNGAAFDSTGKLRDWWTKHDLARFNAAGKALAAQFSAYAPFPDTHVNGELTLGENIADVAGLAAALEAYHASLKGKKAPTLGGLTGDQRFFLAFAQGWASNSRDAALRAQMAVDGHAPGQFRALTVRNLDGWYKAFDVKLGDKLYLPPESRVKIW
jgi:putative endopeptidase